MLEQANYYRAADTLSLVVRGVQRALWLEIPEQSVRQLENDRRILVDAASVLEVPQDVLASEVEPKLDGVIADPTTLEAAYRNLALRNQVSSG